MKTQAMTLVLLALAASPAWAIITEPSPGGGGTKTGRMNVVNQSTTAVYVSINGGSYVLLESAGDAVNRSVPTSKNGTTVSAYIYGASPSTAVSATGSVQANKTTTATITGSDSGISIDMSRPGQIAGVDYRDTNVALAAAGGLLPLLWLGALLGGKPRRNKPQVE